MWNQLSSEVSAQASMLAAHHQQLQKLTSPTEELVKKLQNLHVASLPPNPTPPAPTTPIMIPTPHNSRLSFPKRSKGFLMQCYLYINQQPLTFSTDNSQVSFICSLLTGRALEWTTAIWRETVHPFPLIKNSFVNSMRFSNTRAAERRWERSCSL